MIFTYNHQLDNSCAEHSDFDRSSFFAIGWYNPENLLFLLIVKFKQPRDLIYQIY